MCTKEQVCYDIDLKFQNNYNFPIVLKLSIHNIFNNGKEKKKLRAVFLAKEKGKNIKTQWVTLKTFPFESIERSSLLNKKYKKQNGSRGVMGVLKVIETLPDNTTNTQNITSHYKPVNEIWLIEKK